jgi:hypothetical protein
MGGEVSDLVFAKTGPTVILLAGLQGVGKTTVCAKLAFYLKKLVLSSAFVFENLSSASIHDSLYILIPELGYRARVVCWSLQMFTGLLPLISSPYWEHRYFFDELYFYGKL